MFKFVKEKRRDDGIIVEYYQPTTNIFIDSFSLETGEFSKQKITMFTVHKNVKVYEISSPDFETFFSTPDHGLIVYDSTDKVYKKTSINDILQNKNKYFFVQLIENGKKKHIPLNNIKITLTNENTAFDFTVENNYTFTINNGIAVYDTMAVYAPLTKQVCDKLESIADPVLQIHTGKWCYLIDELVTGISLLTLDEPDMSTQFIKINDENAFFEKCVSSNYTYLLDNYSKTVYIHSRKCFSTVGRFFISLLFETTLINKSVNKRTAQYYLTKLYYNYVCKPIISENKNKQESFRKFQTAIHHIVRVASKAMNMSPVSLVSFLDNGCIDIVREYKESLNSCEKGDETKLLSHFYNEIKNTNKKYSSETKITRVLDQILLSRGYITEDNKKVFIKSSYLDGLQDNEFFSSSYGNRYGLITKVITVGEAGYLFRRLVFCISHVTTTKDRPKDCGTDLYLFHEKYSIEDIFSNLLFRHIVIDDVDYFTDFDGIAEIKMKYGNDKVDIMVRTPMFCKEKQFCKMCLPEEYTYISRKIGIYSAQAICEDLAQDLMRQFHTGGKSSVAKQTISDKFYIYENTLCNKEDMEILSIEFDSNIITVGYKINEEIMYDSIIGVSTYTTFLDELPCIIPKDTKIITYSEDVIENSVRKIVRSLLSKDIDVYNLYKDLEKVNCQSLFKEIVAQAFYLTDKFEPARLYEYDNRIVKCRKYSLHEIPYLNKITGISFANIVHAVKTSKLDDKLENDFFKAIITGELQSLID